MKYIIRSEVFAQLMHAAALAYKSEQWKDCLLCCAASLKCWHFFFITTSPSDKYFVVDQYSILSYSGMTTVADQLHNLYCNVETTNWHSGVSVRCKLLAS